MTTVSNKIYSSKTSNKYFIGYLHDDYEIRPLYKMLPKPSLYEKDENSVDIYFWLKMMAYRTIIILFRRKLKKNIKKELTSEPVRNKIILNSKAKSYG